MGLHHADRAVSCNYVLHERRFFSIITTAPLKLFSCFLKVSSKHFNIFSLFNVEIIIEGSSKLVFACYLRHFFQPLFFFLNH